MAPSKGISLDRLIAVWEANNGSQRATARELGCDVANVVRRIHRAWDNGDERIDPAKLFKKEQKSRTFEEISRARVELGLAAERKNEKGDWRKVSLVTKIKSPVFMLGLFGDPHLDNPGCDLECFEENIERLDASQHIHGLCIGDVFDNWVRALAHAGADSAPAYAAWVLFDAWMEHYPFLSLILGNHDLWNTGTASALIEFCRSRGILVRRSGGTLAIATGQGQPITIAARHIWGGNSQYSEAHSLKRAATFGQTDADLLVGGHFHKGECREHVRPHDGRVSKLAMLDSFKRLDDYANDRGFMSAERPPVVWAVCDSRLPVTSHERVQLFYDFDTARALMDHRRGKNL